MLVLNPRSVVFGSTAWDGVTAIAVDRRAEREVLSWGDLGPHAVLADAPEQRVELRVVQELTREDVGSPRPGEQAELSFHTSPSLASAGRKKVSATAVVLRVTHELRAPAAAIRTIHLVAISADGSADPLVVTDSSGGQA